MGFSVISGDVISSTNLTGDERGLLVASLERLLLQLDKAFEVY